MTRAGNAKSWKRWSRSAAGLRNIPILLLALLLGLTFACKSQPPAAPSGAGTTTVAPDASLGSRELGRTQGYVADTAFERLAGVRVEVLDGPTAGESAMTDADGLFWLPGLVPINSNVTLRATLPGYTTDVESLKSYPTRFGASFESGFYLAPTDPPTVLTSDAYSLTLDLPCAGIPSDLRTQTFRATVTALPNGGWPIPVWLAGHRWPSGTGFGVTIDADEFRSSTDSDRFVLGVAGPKLGVPDMDLWWQVSPARYFEIVAVARAVVPQRASTFSIPVNSVEYCELHSPWIAATRSDERLGFHCSTTPNAQVIARAECFSGSLTLAPR